MTDETRGRVEMLQEYVLNIEGIPLIVRERLSKDLDAILALVDCQPELEGVSDDRLKAALEYAGPPDGKKPALAPEVVKVALKLHESALACMNGRGTPADEIAARIVAEVDAGLREREAKLVKVLEWYADEANYISTETPSLPVNDVPIGQVEYSGAEILDDNGSRAAGVLADRAALRQAPPTEPIAWLGYVDQGMGHGHFEVADKRPDGSYPENAFPVYRAPPEQTGPSIADLLAWMKARPGASWVATIVDVEKAIAALAPRTVKGDAT